MKNKKVALLEKRARCKVPMNIQFFADGGNGGGGDDGNGSGAGGDGGNHQTFDEFLAAGNQAEFDRRVNKAIETAVKNAEEKWRTLTDDKVSEAEKLAKMTAQEKAEYLQKKKEKELADRETQITKRELEATAKNTLTDKGLPVELSEVLNYADAESCNQSITVVEKAFQAAVEKAVEERLKGDRPPKRSSGTDTDDKGANGFVDIIKENQSKR